MAGAADGGVRVRSQQESVGPVDPGKAQLAYRPRDRVRISRDLRRERQDRVAGALTNALNAGRGVAVEHGAIFGEGDLRAASFSGSQSESSAPRSTSSIAWR